MSILAQVLLDDAMPYQSRFPFQVLNVMGNRGAMQEENQQSAECIAVKQDLKNVDVELISGTIAVSF